MIDDIVSIISYVPLTIWYYLQQLLYLIFRFGRPGAITDGSEFDSAEPRMFRVRTEMGKVVNLSSTTDTCVECPYFDVLLKHTVAVLRSLYENKENWSTITVDQIEWAIKFLESLHDKFDENPEDIRECIEYLQDIIFYKYESVDLKTYDDTILGKSHFLQTIPNETTLLGQHSDVELMSISLQDLLQNRDVKQMDNTTA